jgi:ATP-binding cassette subfamily B protein
MRQSWISTSLKIQPFTTNLKEQGSKYWRTILLSQVLSQIQDLITMGFLAAGLIVLIPWLILLLVIAVMPAFIGESYFNDKNYSLSRRQTPERRELDYFRFLGASDETAKEVKIFNCRFPD